MTSYKRSDGHVVESAPLPVGRYKLKAESAPEKPTQAGDGRFVNAKFVVVEGEHRGKALWMNYVVEHPSAEAKRIGREQLTLWHYACGKSGDIDPDDLVGIPFEARVGVEKDGERRKITSYYRNGKHLEIAAPPAGWSDAAQEAREKAEAERKPPKDEPPQRDDDEIPE